MVSGESGFGGGQGMQQTSCAPTTSLPRRSNRAKKTKEIIYQRLLFILSIINRPNGGMLHNMGKEWYVRKMTFLSPHDNFYRRKRPFKEVMILLTSQQLRSMLTTLTPADANDVDKIFSYCEAVKIKHIYYMYVEICL